MMIRNIIGHIANRFLSPLPVVSHYQPLAVFSISGTSSFSLENLLDGYLWATPKHRTPWRRLMQKKYGNDNWKDGTKMWKPKKNIVTCMECGSFHEFHTICKNCFEKVQDESKKIIGDIRAAWTGQAIDREVQVLYKGETTTATVTSKRIVEMDRPRPLWFAPNLSQITAEPDKKISGPSVPLETLEAKLKNSE